MRFAAASLAKQTANNKRGGLTFLVFCFFFYVWGEGFSVGAISFVFGMAGEAPERSQNAPRRLFFLGAGESDLLPNGFWKPLSHLSLRLVLLWGRAPMWVAQSRCCRHGRGQRRPSPGGRRWGKSEATFYFFIIFCQGEGVGRVKRLLPPLPRWRGRAALVRAAVGEGMGGGAEKGSQRASEGSSGCCLAERPIERTALAPGSAPRRPDPKRV